jgi:hypothetical protein
MGNPLWINLEAERMYSVEQEKVCDSVNDVDCNIIYEKKCEEGKVLHFSQV